ncbi:MAG: hypothetical protein P4N59_11465 [Negativicutes bacterium]|nr:hypothetical protein [Negativicutes bacterium]
MTPPAASQPPTNSLSADWHDLLYGIGAVVFLFLAVYATLHTGSFDEAGFGEGFGIFSVGAGIHRGIRSYFGAGDYVPEPSNPDITVPPGG